MRFSYNTYGRSSDWGGPPTLPEQFRAAADAGYDHVGIDLPAVEAHLAAGTTLDRLRSDLDATGISCHEVIALHIDEDETTTLREIARAWPIVEAFDGRAVLVVPAGDNDDVARNVDACAEAFAVLGTETAIEFVAGRPLDTLGAAASLIGRCRADVKVVVDVWHFARGPDSDADLAAVPADRIAFIQLSDAPPPISDDTLWETRHRRVMPGDGVLDVVGFCRTVRDVVGYDGVASVEILSDEWRSADLSTFVRRSLESSRSVCLT